MKTQSMSKSIRIDRYEINKQNPAFIIAEIGVNHNGNVDFAKKLISEAKKCGANCVKFQTFHAENIVTKDSPKADYQKKTTKRNESQFEMLKQLELSKEDYKEIIYYCKKKNILFLSTPYSIADVDFLDRLKICAFKIASCQIVEPYFLRYIAEKKKPIILSTGMASFGEVDEAVRIIRDAGNEQIVLLQCTTDYPSRIEDCNLKSMQAMSAVFNTLVGYSDHTNGIIPAVVAIALGAKVIEKHFTLDKNLPGPDHAASAAPKEFYTLVKNIRAAEASLGSSIKEPSKIEVKNSRIMRRSITAVSNIKKGSKIESKMIGFKRPNEGLSPSMYSKIIGKTCLKDISKDSKITLKDIKW